MNPNEGSSWLEKVTLPFRIRLRSGVRRLRDAGWQIFQTAVAAGAAWFLAFLILGHERPVFASIAAVISLGLAVGQRVRRAIELVLGVAFGVAVADLLVLVIGIGPIQMGILVALAMAAAVFLGVGLLTVSEAAISAMILMVTFQPSEVGFSPDRFLEALVGGGTALLINALLPINPERMVTKAAHPVFGESAAVLEEVAAALDDGDFERAQHALIRAREIDARVSGFKEALDAGRETARIAPPRRRTLGHLELYTAVADQIDLTVRDVRGLARTALSVVSPDGPAPEQLSLALRNLGQATEALATYLESPDDPEDTRRFALEAAEEATALLEERKDLTPDLAINALVNQIQSAAIDILRSSGMDREDALQALEEVAGRAPEPD